MANRIYAFLFCQFHLNTIRGLTHTLLKKEAGIQYDLDVCKGLGRQLESGDTPAFENRMLQGSDGDLISRKGLLLPFTERSDVAAFRNVISEFMQHVLKLIARFFEEVFLRHM